MLLGLDLAEVPTFYPDDVVAMSGAKRVPSSLRRDSGMGIVSRSGAYVPAPSFDDVAALIGGERPVERASKSGIDDRAVFLPAESI
jgi:hypothetical protein